jgi:acetyl-CoA decarbonylase/synthase complex subunit gamma
MALTGLQIFKLLPNTNCRKCGSPTCLAFAMKLAAGKESLDKCPDASDEARAALGAASAPPIRGVTIGRGPRAITVGEETVFFRHEKTFVHKTALFRVVDPQIHAEATDPQIHAESADPQIHADLRRTADPPSHTHVGSAGATLDDRLRQWAAVRIERAGEVFEIDGVAVVEPPGGRAAAVAAVGAAAKAGFPVAILAASADGAAAMIEAVKGERPLLVPPQGADIAPYAGLAARFGVALVVSAPDVDTLATRAAEVARGGVTNILLKPAAKDAAALHRDLSLIRRGALDRVHPGLAYPVFLRTACHESSYPKTTPGLVSAGLVWPSGDDFARAVVGVTKFASIVAVDDPGGETWLPLWTLRQNIYTDPQKPLQMTPGVYPIGEPDAASPLLVTTNFSLTYFIVSTELEATGVASHLAVVDSEGMSVLTAWSAGKFSGDRVAKALKEMGIPDRVQHRTVIIPGYVAVISGELEDGLGAGWRVLTGPQEASDIAPFLRDVWARV